MSTDDAWALPETSAAGYGAPVAYIQTGKAQDAQRTLWLIVAGLFLVAGAAEFALLFVRSSNTLAGGLGYEYLAVDAYYGLRAVVLLACGTLLLVRRTRELASAMAVGIALIWLTQYFYALRPATIARASHFADEWFYLASFALAVIGGVLALAAVSRRGARTAADADPGGDPGTVTRTGTHTGPGQSMADRSVAVLVALAGAGLWILAQALAWQQFVLHTAQAGTINGARCCTWSQLGGWEHGSIIAGGLTALVLAAFGAMLRSKTRAAGLLLGLLLIPLSEVAENVVCVIAPMPALYSVNYRRLVGDSISLDYHVLAGFWLGTAGLVLFAVAALLRILLARRGDPYAHTALGRVRSS